MDGYFYIPYEYLLEKRLINYLDGLWAITDIIPRSNHKPTVRRLVVPGHEHDERRKRDLIRKTQMNQFPTIMRTKTMRSYQQLLLHRRSMPITKDSINRFWYY